MTNVSITVAEPDLTSVCNSFPVPTGVQIYGQHLVSLLERTLGSGIEVLTVEGADGIGKTTLLSQFAKAHCSRSISLFARPASRFAYDPEILLRDLYNQMHYAVLGRELSVEQRLDDGLFRRLLAKLQQRARLRHSCYYFVLDGLETIPKESLQLRDALLSMLPFGFSSFRFILSGDSSELLKGRRLAHKPLLLPYFTFDESLNFLSDVSAPKELVEELFKTYDGFPVLLASAKRILQSGVSARQLLDDLRKSAFNLFELEWGSIPSSNKIVPEILALLASDPRKHTVPDLAYVFEVPADSIKALLSPLKFVRIPGDDKDGVEFVSEAFRKFAADKLRDLVDAVYTRLVDSLWKNQQSEAALSNLPVYLASAGRHSDLIEYLSPDHFAKMLERSQSLSPLQQQAELGIESAIKLDSTRDLMRFGIQRSVFTELSGCEVLRSEIEARMALGRYETSVALAQSAVLNHDRIRLLAVVIRNKRQQGLAPEPELIEQVERLFSEIDFAALGDAALELAPDLLYVKPELAIQIVERARLGAFPQERADWTLAHLALRAAASREQEDYQTREKTIESIRTHIRNPEVAQFSTSIAILLHDYSAARVISEARKIESPNDRLFLLRNWAVNTRHPEEAADVLDYALDLTISTVTYTPHAQHFRELATPLPKVANQDRVRALVGTFDAQKATVERVGPSEDFVRLQLTLAHAQSKYDFNSAAARLIEIYFYVNQRSDLGLRAASMAFLVGSLQEIDPEKRLEASDGLHSVAERELEEYVDRLLRVTADHTLATREIITALAIAKPDLAFKLAAMLNTEPRRNRAIEELIKEQLSSPISKLPLRAIRHELAGIKNPDVYDELVEDIWSRPFVSENDAALKGLAPEFLPLTQAIRTIKSLELRTKCAYKAVCVMARCGLDQYAGLTRDLLSTLESAWSSISDDMAKIDLGFDISAALAKQFRPEATRFLQLTEELRDRVGFDQGLATYVGNVRLAVRAFSGLMPSSLDTTQDLTRVADCIDRIPSPLARLAHWLEISLRFFKEKQEDKGRRIVVDRVKPLLSRLELVDLDEWETGTIRAAPALYLANRITATETINKLLPQWRDFALDEIATFLFRRHPGSDPYETTYEARYEISYDDAVEVCSLIEQIENDRLIYANVDWIVSSALWKKNKFSQNQKDDLAHRLTKAAEARLPAPRYIQHEGYKIITRAQIARLAKQTDEFWEQLIESGRLVPNLADRCMVLTILSERSSITDKNREALFREAKQIAEQIPSLYDRVGRSEIIARSCYEFDRHLAHTCIREALNASGKSDDPELIKVRRNLVDLAHKIDHEFAGSLASSLDDDEARKEVRTEVAERKKLADLKDKMMGESDGAIGLSTTEVGAVSRAAWSLLGSLNAGRVAPVRISSTRNHIRQASKLPLSQAFPILSWVIENANRRIANADEAKTTIRSIYEATLLGCELSSRLAVRATDRLRQTASSLESFSNTKGVVIHSGERTQALEFLRKWMSESARDYIKICDPFFGPDELEVLNLVLVSSPELKVYILSSKKWQDQIKVPAPWEEAYRNQWRIRLSDQNPPSTRIIIVGLRSSGELPIHDRWWITKGGGLRLGTSLNSLGVTKDSDISQMSAQEASEHELEVDQYLSSQKYDHNGEPLSYAIFNL